MSTPAELTPALYVVATPIGNLEDITLRAMRVLRTAHTICCEDTRTSAPLLASLGATGRRLAVHDHNEAAAAAGVVELIAQGQVVALISDAGTPLVSDPGHAVVAAVVAAGLPVVPIPGASSVMAALMAAGLAASRFQFVGFLPDRNSRREALLAEVADQDATLIFFAPARELATALAWLGAGLGQDRPAVVAREITKLHEEFARGTLAQLAAAPPTPRGEAVILVAGAPPQRMDPLDLDRDIDAGLAAGEASSALAKRLAKTHRVARGAVYQRILERKGSPAG